MKKIISLLFVLVLTLSLASCGVFECDLCGETKSGKKNTQKIFGEEITYCSDCKDDLMELGAPADLF